MSYRNSKVVIVGAGKVGSTTAFSIISQGLCEDVCLIDVNREHAVGEALDMSDSIFFMHRNVSVHAGDYDDCADADIVIITAAAPMPKDSTDRLEMLKPSLGVVREVVQKVMASGFGGIFLVVSNPVDIMTYYTWKVSGLPAQRDSEIVSWNSATIGGKRVDAVMRDNADRTAGVTREDLRKRTVQAGWDIFSRKGNTCYGIAASATAICKTILFDENRIVPVSVYVEGQYGIDGIYLSVPTIVDHTGAKEIVEIDLEKDELDALRKSADLLGAFYDRLDA